MATPRHILIFIPNWVGDVVMATAALAAIRRRFEKAHIVHVMRPYVADVLAGADLANEQRFWPQRGTNQSTLSLVRDLRSRQADIAVLLTNSFRSAAVAWLAGARRRVGYARDGRSWLLTDRLEPKRADGDFVPVPALDYYNDLARHIGCEDVSDQLVLATTPDDEAAVDRRLQHRNGSGPLIVMNPGAHFGSAKCWPAEYYAHLADELVERYDARVVASLAPKESQIAQDITRSVRHPIDVIVDPPLGLGPLKALVRRADLLITNDTGPRHFAAAFDVPVVTIFGSSDPAWTDTRFARERIAMLDLECQPCMQRLCPLKHHDCMKKLSPAMVIEKVEELLGRRSPLPVVAD